MQDKDRVFINNDARFQVTNRNHSQTLEILLGANDSQTDFRKSFFDQVQVLSFDQKPAIIAAQICKQLKTQNKLIAIADILIASIALNKQAPLATLN